MSPRNLPSYDRAPSEKLQKLLSPGEFLAPLLDKREVAGCELDVHFRRDDHVKVYCGLTSLLEVNRVGDKIKFVAADTYTKQACAKGLFRTWRVAEPGFAKALDAYLEDVVVNEKKWIEGEGRVQEAWSRATEYWIPFDREAVLKYKPEKDGMEAKKFDQVDKAHAELKNIAESQDWAILPDKGNKRNEIDQLAVDLKGRLVIVELKDASASGVYYAPFQLLQYVWEWDSALKLVQGQLQALIDARKGLGLTPCSVPPITGGIRAAIGFGTDSRSKKVKRRYAVVLDVINKYLPPGIPWIETWVLNEQNRPRLGGYENVLSERGTTR